MQHKHTLLARSRRARLEVCHECETSPYILRTRSSIGAKLKTDGFYSDREAAMTAYQEERTKE